MRFKLTLKPTDEAVALGAAPLKNTVDFDSGLWFDSLTGYGCIAGFVAPSEVIFKDQGGSYSFTALCRGQDEADEAQVEWTGKLKNGKLTGDVWITLPGPKLTAEVIAAKRRADQETIKSKAVYVSGALANGNELSRLTEQSETKNALLASHGQRIHYTFTTDTVEITPTGEWPKP